MGEATLVVIHCDPQIKWQGPFAEKMRRGLRVLGLKTEVTGSRHRVSDAPAVLLGTTRWRDVEGSGNYLLVDRCSFNDTNDFVSLVWNGHGRRGDHKVPKNHNGKRWKEMEVKVHPWRRGSHVVLCGQTESYSPKWPSMRDWYEHMAPSCTHFRNHPAQPVNPTLLSEWCSFDDCASFVTLNSSVAVDSILHGIQTNVFDEGGMAWPGMRYGEDRQPLLNWLAWTQWSHDEITAGKPMKHLFGDI